MIDPRNSRCERHAYGRRCCLCFIAVSLVSAVAVCAVFVLSRADTASVLLSLHYQEASIGCYPTGERLLMSDFLDDAVLSPLMEQTGLSAMIGCDDLRPGFSVEPVMPENAREPYLTSTYRISFTLPESLAGSVTARDVANGWAAAFAGAFARRAFPENAALRNSDVPDVSSSPAAPAAWLDARRSQLIRLAEGYADAYPGFRSEETGLTFHDVFLRLAALPKEDVTPENLSYLADDLAALAAELQRESAAGMLSFTSEAEPFMTREQYMRAGLISLCAGLAACCVSLLAPIGQRRRTT